MEGTVTAMEAFLGTISTFFTQCIDWVGELLTAILASPGLTVVVFGTLIVGFVFGLVGRLFRVR